MLTFRMNPNAFVEEITLQVGHQAKLPSQCVSLPGQAGGPCMVLRQSDSAVHSSCADGGAAEEAQEVRRGLTWRCAISTARCWETAQAGHCRRALVHLLPSYCLTEATAW